MSSRIAKKQQGVSIIIVVFILLALSILAAALVQILTASSESVAREVLSARAFMAAESGAQRMLNDITVGDETDCVTQNYTFTAFEGCAVVEVACTYVQIPAVTGDLYYTIKSTGKCGPSSDNASRAIEVQAKNI